MTRFDQTRKLAKAAPVLALALSGCMHITTQMLPDNEVVKGSYEGSDCSYIVFGIGFGDNTVEKAMANSDPPLVKVRRTTLRDWNFLGLVGARCLEVVGEGAGGAAPKQPWRPKEDPRE